MERLGTDLRIPLPASTQWAVVSAALKDFEPICALLIEAAAAGRVVYIDDTTARVLDLNDERTRQRCTERKYLR